jgi:hypothetical protein
MHTGSIQGWLKYVFCCDIKCCHLSDNQETREIVQLYLGCSETGWLLRHQKLSLSVPTKYRRVKNKELCNQGKKKKKRKCNTHEEPMQHIYSSLLPSTPEIMMYDIDSDLTNSVKGYAATNEHLRTCVVTYWRSSPPISRHLKRLNVIKVTLLSTKDALKGLLYLCPSTDSLPRRKSRQAKSCRIKDGSIFSHKSFGPQTRKAVLWSLHRELRCAMITSSWKKFFKLHP